MNYDDLSVKKRIMFIKDEDYYYLTYNILVILDYFGCYNIDNLFRDYRKLSYLVYFLSSDKNTEMFQKASNSDNEKLSLSDYENLLQIYTKSKFINSQIKRLLFSLNQRQFIEIIKDDKFSSVSLYMKDKDKIKEVLNNELFQTEYKRVEKIKQSYSRLRSVKYETFLEKVFKANGVGKWDD